MNVEDCIWSYSLNYPTKRQEELSNFKKKENKAKRKAILYQLNPNKYGEVSREENLCLE